MEEELSVLGAFKRILMSSQRLQNIYEQIFIKPFRFFDQTFSQPDALTIKIMDFLLAILNNKETVQELMQIQEKHQLMIKYDLTLNTHYTKIQSIMNDLLAQNEQNNDNQIQESEQSVSELTDSCVYQGMVKSKNSQISQVSQQREQSKQLYQLREVPLVSDYLPEGQFSSPREDTKRQFSQLSSINQNISNTFDQLELMKQLDSKQNTQQQEAFKFETPQHRSQFSFSPLIEKGDINFQKLHTEESVASIPEPSYQLQESIDLIKRLEQNFPSKQTNSHPLMRDCRTLDMLHQLNQNSQKLEQKYMLAKSSECRIGQSPPIRNLEVSKSTDGYKFDEYSDFPQKYPSVRNIKENTNQQQKTISESEYSNNVMNPQFTFNQWNNTQQSEVNEKNLLESVAQKLVKMTSPCMKSNSQAATRSTPTSPFTASPLAQSPMARVSTKKTERSSERFENKQFFVEYLPLKKPHRIKLQQTRSFNIITNHLSD